MSWRTSSAPPRSITNSQRIRSLRSVTRTARTSPLACCYFDPKHSEPPFCFEQWSRSYLKNCRIFPLRACGSAREIRIQSFQYPRSEEHTSELQSQSNLVCRLLLD